MTDLRAEHHLTNMDADGEQCSVTVRFAYDGIEHIGHLWFSGPAVGDKPIPDHGAVPGRTTDEAMELARRLTHDDLMRRLYRARAEKRRYFALRRATEQILEKVKYMNRVAVSMRTGMLDTDGASQELDLIVKQLHDVVDTLGSVAGVEG